MGTYIRPSQKMSGSYDLFCIELNKWLNEFELIRLVYNRIPLTDYAEKDDYISYKPRYSVDNYTKVFGCTVDWYKGLTYLKQVVSLYLAGATLKELYLCDFSRLRALINAIDFTEAEFITLSHDFDLHFVITKDYRYIIPRCLKDFDYSNNIKYYGSVQKASAVDSSKTCYISLQLSKRFKVPVELQTPLSPLKDKYDEFLNSKVYTEPIYPVLKCKVVDKDWKNLWFTVEASLPSTFTPEDCKKNLSVINKTVARNLEVVLVTKGYSIGMFECSSKRFYQSILIYRFDIKKEIRELLEGE